MAGDKKGAAVLIRLDGDFIGADLLGLLRDFLFVHPDQGAEHGEFTGLLDHREVLQGLRSHLPQALARDQCL
jgi:hypothetical protein